MHIFKAAVSKDGELEVFESSKNKQQLEAIIAKLIAAYPEWKSYKVVYHPTTENIMAKEDDFTKPVSIAKNICPDCKERMERKENGFFAVGDEKYRCMNTKCPGKKPLLEERRILL